MHYYYEHVGSCGVTRAKGDRQRPRPRGRAVRYHSESTTHHTSTIKSPCVWSGSVLHAHRLASALTAAWVPSRQGGVLPGFKHVPPMHHTHARSTPIPLDAHRAFPPGRSAQSWSKGPRAPPMAAAAAAAHPGRCHETAAMLRPTQAEMPSAAGPNCHGRATTPEGLRLGCCPTHPLSPATPVRVCRWARRPVSSPAGGYDTQLRSLPSSCISDVHNVRLSLSNCIMSALSL